MSKNASTTRTSSSTLIGLAVGVVLLALVVCFAVLLPKADGDDSSSSSSSGSLTLPDTLSGGFTAVDLEAAFASRPAAEAATYAKQQAATRAYTDKVLGDVLDEDAVSRTYASKDLAIPVFVQAFRAAGGAFAPDSIPDPAVTGQERTQQELVKQGDAVCIVQWTPVEAGAEVDPATPPTYTSCQRSEGELTVQVGVPSTPVKDVGTIVDEVWASVA